MAIQLTAQDARQTLLAHVEGKGVEAFVKYGPCIGWEQLQRLLADRTIVRYPCEIVFDTAGLLPGEFAHPVPKGDVPEAGFTLFVHPVFEHNRDRAPYAVLYQLVVVNYGEFAGADEAETFGAAALGLTRDEYYAALCAISDQLGGMPETPEPAPSCGRPGCSCGG